MSEIKRTSMIGQAAMTYMVKCDRDIRNFDFNELVCPTYIIIKTCQAHGKVKSD